MAQPITPLSISAPGFYGLNTQASPVDMEQRFALAATNCIIDRAGRIASRKGWEQANSASADLSTGYAECTTELVRNDGTTTILTAGNNKLLRLASGALVNLTYGGGGVAPVITASKWQAVTLNDTVIFVQVGYDPLIYDPAVSTTTYRRVSERSGAVGTPPQASCAVSAFGRVWAAGVSTNKNIVYWSDTLSPHVWSGGTSGSLDLRGVWPSGGDTIVALAAHNNSLIIFGRKQTLIYTGASYPPDMALSDTIGSIGCISRDTVQNTGEDVIFLSDLGVKSLMRTIQEKSAPLRSISANVNDDIQDYATDGIGTSIIAGYSPIDSFYLLTFVDRAITYCFDLRAPLPDGSARTTVWNIAPRSYCFSQTRVFYMGFAGRIGTHSSYLDNGSAYRIAYYTPWIDFGQPIRISILKKVIITLIGTQGQGVVLKWGFDYMGFQSSNAPVTSSTPIAEYGLSEYGIGEYTDSVVSVISVNAGGSGKLTQIGFEVDMAGYPVAVQRMDIFVKEGRL